LTVSKLSVEFGSMGARTKAVDEVSFCVADGEVFGLVGESGCGKSTILRTVAGLNRDWKGQIEVVGTPVGRSRPSDFYKNLQMVFQDPYGSLHPRKTVHSILSEPVRIHRLGDADARIVEVLRKVGLEAKHRFRFPHQLSGGQRQRVAIARSLILAPRVLLLDEPTSALDVSVQAEILNLLADIRATTRMTYVLVSHDLAVIAHMCDRVAVMCGGKIVEEMTANDLIRGRCCHAYTRQLLESSHGYTKRRGGAGSSF
jgi:peptide/nickel transport system ATP-binding protein